MSDFRSSGAESAAQEALRPARTYTPEAIMALVKAAEDARDNMQKEARWLDLQQGLEATLRPFATEAPSYQTFRREMSGEPPFENPAHDEDVCRSAYRARYGVEP